jgi:hypothetical protein
MDLVAFYTYLPKKIKKPINKEAFNLVKFLITNPTKLLKLLIGFTEWRFSLWKSKSTKKL